MLRQVGWLVVLGGLTLAGPGRADPPAAKGLDPAAALSVLGGGNSTDALAGSLRGALVKGLPDPLFQDNRHWGRKAQGPLGKWKNDGEWWRVAVRSRNLPDTLVLDVRDLQAGEGGRTTFTLFVSFDAGVDLERQHWRLGLRLYSGSTRARLRVKLALQCEAVLRLEGKGLVPDAVFRLRVLRSDLRYDNFVVEHTAGVGGEAAKILGDAALGGLRQWKPSLERSLLARANEAVVKAGDTREVRLSLMQALGGKK